MFRKKGRWDSFRARQSALFRLHRSVNTHSDLRIKTLPNNTIERVVLTEFVVSVALFKTDCGNHRKPGDESTAHNLHWGTSGIRDEKLLALIIRFSHQSALGAT